jgi:hypothetical protein
MREIRLSGSEGGAGSIPVPTPILTDPSPASSVSELSGLVTHSNSVPCPPSALRFLRLLRLFAAIGKSFLNLI